MVLFSARSEVLDALSPPPSHYPATTLNQPNAQQQRPLAPTPRRKRPAPQASPPPMDGISDSETRAGAAMRQRRAEFDVHVGRAWARAQTDRAREPSPNREGRRKHRVVVEIETDSEEERRAASRLADEYLHSDGVYDADPYGERVDNEEEDEDEEEEVVPLPDQTGNRQFPIELSPEPDDAAHLEQYKRAKEFEREAERRKAALRAKRAKEEEREEEKEDLRARRTPGRAARELKEQEQLVAEALQALSTKWSVAEETIRQRAEEAQAGPSTTKGQAFNRPRGARKEEQEEGWQWRGNEFAQATERIRRQAEAARAAAEAELGGERRRTTTPHARDDSPDVEIVEPLPDLAKLQRIRAQFQATERQEANKRKAAEDRARRKREADEARYQKDVEEGRARLEQSRRQRELEERARRQREEAARQVREERERRLREQRREFEKQLEEAARELRKAEEAERAEREGRRRAEERVRREQEERERLKHEQETREREERERRRREQERHTDRMRREQQRQQQQQQQQQQRRKGARTMFDDDEFDPFAGFARGFPGFGNFGEGFTFEQFADPFGGTYTRAGFHATPPPGAASGSGRANGSTPLRATKPRPKLNYNPAPEDVAAAWTAYEQRWAGLGSLPDSPEWTFSTIPWPVTYPISNPQALEPLTVRRFLLATVHSQGKSKKERVRAAMLRWHPDKFCPKWLGKVRESDRDAVKEGVNAVSRILGDLQAECA